MRASSLTFLLSSFKYTIHLYQGGQRTCFCAIHILVGTSVRGLYFYSSPTTTTSPTLIWKSLLIVSTSLTAPCTRFYEIKSIDYRSLLRDAYNLPWHEVIKYSYLIGLYDNHAPLTVKPVTKRPATCRTKSPVDRDAHKRLRNITKPAIRSSEVRHLHTYFSNRELKLRIALI